MNRGAKVYQFPRSGRNPQSGGDPPGPGPGNT